MNAQWKKVIPVILILLFAVGTTILITGHLTLHLIYSYIINSIRSATGLNKYLANALAIFGAILFAYGIRLYFKSIFNPFRKGTREKYIGISLIVSLLILFNLGLYYSTKSTYFDFKEGKISKWYADTPEGIRFFDSPGFDPKYGIKLKPASPELIVRIERQKIGNIPERITLTDINQIEFFDKLSGQGKVWCYVDSEGHYQLFNGPGHHPKNGESLLPVTKDIYVNIKNQFKQRISEEKSLQQAQKKRSFLKANLNINDSNLNKSNRQEVAVLVINYEKKYDGKVSKAIAAKLDSTGFFALNSLFTDSFMKSTLFWNIFNGNIEAIQQLELYNLCDLVLLGTAKNELSNQSGLQGIITSTYDVSMRMLSCKTGKIYNEYSLIGIGSGFSNNDAQDMAIDNIIENIKLPSVSMVD